MISEPMACACVWQVLDDTSFRYTRKNGKTRVLCGKPSDWAEARIVTTSYTEFELHTPSCEVTNPGPSSSVLSISCRMLSTFVRLV